MKSLPFAAVLLRLIFASKHNLLQAQVQASLYEGMVIGGYVDQGGYLNFTGPNIHLTRGHSVYVLGMLPSLRFREDEGSPRNAFVTPNLGIGFSYSYKLLAIQMPFYYNPKTATENGRWHVGLGLGLNIHRFSETERGREAREEGQMSR